MLNYFLLFILVILYSLNPLFKKLGSINVTTDEFIVIYQPFAILLAVLYLVYLICIKKVDLYSIKKLSTNELYYTLGSVLTGVIGFIILLYLIKLSNLSDLIPNVQAFVILLNMILAYYVLNEKITRNKIIGTFFIIIGILCLNKKSI